MFKKVYVEITNVCNLHCMFCQGTKREKKFIKINDYKILLEKLKEYTDYLYFHVMGEPLMHPDINDLIDLASKDFKINITTNGYLIKKIRNNNNIRQINISLHSFDEKYGKSLDEYLNDIFLVCDELSKKGTYISYRLWVSSINSIKIKKLLSKHYDVEINKNKVKLAKNVFWEIEKSFVWPSLNNDVVENDEGTCMGTRSHIGILVDGTVVPCCLDSDGIINLGNIYKHELSDIINSTLFQKIKNGFLNDKKVHKLCKKCNFYNLRKGKK